MNKSDKCFIINIMLFWFIIMNVLQNEHKTTNTFPYVPNDITTDGRQHKAWQEKKKVNCCSSSRKSRYY